MHRIILLLAQVVFGLTVLWAGFQAAEVEIPSLGAAPWFWAIVLLALVAPVRYWWCDGTGGLDWGEAGDD